MIDAEGALIMPGGIDPHTHLEMPFMGTTTAETWQSGTYAALSGGTTLVVDFVLPDQGGLLSALDAWEERAARQACGDYSFHVAITGWSQKIFEEMADGGWPRGQHVQAFHGLQGRPDGQ